MRTSLTAAIAALLVLAGNSPGNDREGIQGTWTVVEAEFDGKPYQFVDTQFTFRGDAVINSRQPNAKARFLLEPGTNPPALDMIMVRENQERRLLYAYQLEGDTLLLCLTRQSEINRPTTVSSRNNQLLLTLKRQRE